VCTCGAPVQAGFSPLHYLVCHPLCPADVLAAVAAVHPPVAVDVFPWRHLLEMEEDAQLLAPHEFERELPNHRRYHRRLGRHFLMREPVLLASPEAETMGDGRDTDVVLRVIAAAATARKEWPLVATVNLPPHLRDLIMKEMPLASPLCVAALLGYDRLPDVQRVAVLLQCGADAHTNEVGSRACASRSRVGLYVNCIVTRVPFALLCCVTMQLFLQQYPSRGMMARGCFRRAVASMIHVLEPDNVPAHPRMNDEPYVTPFYVACSLGKYNLAKEMVRMDPFPIQLFSQVSYGAL
jgi:hypothetical protein